MHSNQFEQNNKPQNPQVQLKIKATGNPMKYVEYITKLLGEEKTKEVEIAAVGQAITNLMLTSSILAEYVEFLYRVNSFAFKPCEYCMGPYNGVKDERMLSSEEVQKLLKEQEINGRDDNNLYLSCRKSKGNHYVITFCQRISKRDIYDHQEPGYMKPKDIPLKGITLEQILKSYAGSHFLTKQQKDSNYESFTSNYNSNFQMKKKQALTERKHNNEDEIYNYNIDEIQSKHYPMNTQRDQHYYQNKDEVFNNQENQYPYPNYDNENNYSNNYQSKPYLKKSFSHKQMPEQFQVQEDLSFISQYQQQLSDSSYHYSEKPQNQMGHNGQYQERMAPYPLKPPHFQQQLQHTGSMIHCDNHSPACNNYYEQNHHFGQTYQGFQQSPIDRQSYLNMSGNGIQSMIKKNCTDENCKMCGLETLNVDNYSSHMENAGINYQNQSNLNYYGKKQFNKNSNKMTQDFQTQDFSENFVKPNFQFEDENRMISMHPKKYRGGHYNNDEIRNLKMY